jgi:hypothetical protein
VQKTSEADLETSSLAVATLDANQIIDVRWRTGSDKIGMGIGPYINKKSTVNSKKIDIHKMVSICFK